MSDNTKRIFVLGNGPSMRGFDFKRFKDVHTVGCNAAYRYWDKIDWYPDYYCCMDFKLIQTHHNQIKDLLISGKVKKIFVRDTFFNFHPEMKGNKDIDTLEYLRSRSRYIGSHFPHITTGTFAIRYVMHLGYKNIYLLGIDCRYINNIPEATGIGGAGLKIIKPVKHNPNYFFDDYQKVGDLYHIANPGCDLHGDAIKLLRKDLEKKNITDVKIINCNKESFIYDNNVFPYRDVNSII